MKLVIAEKPSVARSIASVIGATTNKDGYVEGNGYKVSWCVGHLVGLCNAEEYDERYATWNYDDLPIVPESWKSHVLANTKKQFQILKKLMHDKEIDTVVCATDAGREGELIFRLVYEQAGCQKPVKRLWISSMEESAIRKGMNELKDGAEYDALYESALSRAKADWLVGINATRLFSVLYRKKLNVGRVMSPTLAMIVDRNQKVSEFKKEKYYTTHLKFGSFDEVSKHFVTREEADQVARDCNERKFELPELKLLVDAVQSSKFITSKKSKELIDKLNTMTSQYNGHQLQRQVFIFNRPKTGNETIYYNVDQIHTAIYENKQIEFQYTIWTERKEVQLKKNGAFYKVSPWSLTWDDENYYLIAYDEQADCIKHYRVDKMQQMHILDESRIGREKFIDFDLAEFAKKTFGMYGGRDADVTLLCHNSLAGVILDRFGLDVWIHSYDEEHFKVTVPITVSRQFFGWIAGIGNQMKILEPQSVREEFKNYMMDILKDY